MKFLVVTLLLTLTIRYTESHRPRFDFEKACCVLEWTPLIGLESDRKAIPATAVLFGQRKDQIKIYLASNGTNYAVVTDEQLDWLNFWQNETGLNASREWDKAFVLSNPQKCQIGWFARGKDRFIQNTMERYFPAVGAELFAKVDDQGVIDKIGILKPSGKVEAPQDFEGMNVMTKANFHEKNPGNTHVLFVDCSATLKKQLKAELYDIEFESNNFAAPSEANKQVLATTEVINNSDEDQVVAVDLKADMSSSLEMKHETKLNEVTDVKWGVHGSTSLGWMAKLFGIKLDVDGGYDSHTTKNKFASEGQVSFEARETAYQFHQKILIKAQTKTKIAINTNQIEGSQKYTAYYRIKPDQDKLNSFNETSIRTIFTRLGHPDLKLESINGSLIFRSQGFMSISAGFNTHVLIESVSLKSDSEIVFRQKMDL